MKKHKCPICGKPQWNPKALSAHVQQEHQHMMLGGDPHDHAQKAAEAKRRSLSRLGYNPSARRGGQA